MSLYATCVQGIRSSGSQYLLYIPRYIQYHMQVGTFQVVLTYLITAPPARKEPWKAARGKSLLLDTYIYLIDVIGDTKFHFGTSVLRTTKNPRVRWRQRKCALAGGQVGWMWAKVHSSNFSTQALETTLEARPDKTSTADITNHQLTP